MNSGFASKYGPWAVVAGASEGIGAAFATGLAQRGVNLILVARRSEPLTELAGRLPVESVPVAADLSTKDGLDAVFSAAEGKAVGSLVCNAAYAPVSRFLELTPSRLETLLDLNCRAPLLLARHFLPDMVARGSGGVIVMSSLAGNQGSPGLAGYAASKAFGAVLAESLWAELRSTGVDVLACVAGAVSTPGYHESMKRPAPGTVTAQTVAETALKSLGRGPRAVPGAMMRVSSVLMSRLLPRRTAIQVIGKASSGLAQ
ncbi:SDR family NAD(P)-dependent oxidoreductase [Rugosimonospora africana]|uniref:Short-chain dehydrogenase n=1 Tax=Rugosimonospora africana TaxID=556532 RepID=A0A8J3R418_9ACTN|nr:SDR family NAD(P)-dependent oxidoreductase [Rugosimonospora africana]GIH21077.1 short-chain dehydrogenase [Rugosimonospora africana]